MSTSIVAFLLLTKFRAVSAVVNCVTFDCGIVTGSDIITAGSWVQVDGRGSWKQRKVGINCNMRKLYQKHFKRRCEYCGSAESAVKHALNYMTELVNISLSPDDEQRIVPILKLPTVIGLTHLSNQCIQVFLVESIIGEYVCQQWVVMLLLHCYCIACSVNSILGGSPETAAVNGTIIYQEEVPAVHTVVRK